ncbi:DUF4880 domain-containing protein [Hankyongella ginsenosidimutans]|uniref:DUF4880 domain-containing protein n=1 Tax=Hankyongella ginsenosidimutans TaxID=1763828 RepID=A0A4D7BTA0_9SPHN|nr:DUF4880 domain-containing protein [Hankyongella ginsenosidimutans]
MSGDHDDSPLSQAEHEAVEWLSRLREGGRRYQSEFEEWYSADQTHADAYDRVLATYEEARRPARSARSRQYWGMAIASIAAVLALFAYLGVPKRRRVRRPARPMRLTPKSAKSAPSHSMTAPR